MGGRREPGARDGSAQPDRPTARLDVVSLTRALAITRLGFVALTVIALVALVGELSTRGVFDPVNFFSYFTVQSNLIGVVVLLGSALRGWSGAGPSRTWDLIRGAAVLYLTVTLIVFALLLSGAEVGIPLPWVDLVLHKVFPIVLIADWLIDPPQRLYLREALWWLAYPLVWTAYSLIRGAATGWYPYPFLDPANGGYQTVAGYVGGILVGGIVLIVILITVGNVLRDRKGSTA